MPKIKQKKGGRCGWGICKDCGVIPFLYKHHKGVLIEVSSEIAEIKERELNKIK